MKKYKVYILAVFSLLIITACSSSQEMKSEKEIEKKSTKEFTAVAEKLYKINEIESWMNLMPGGESSFHLSGDVILTELCGLDMKSTRMLNVAIVQDNKTLIEFKPNSSKGDVTGNNSSYFQFSTNRGIKMPPLFNAEKSITAILSFTDGKDEFKVSIDELTVQKIY